MEVAKTIIDEESREILRLATLQSYEILDTDPEASFDKITKLAANLFKVPVALITFVDDRRQWFKSAIGTTATEVPRDIAFCTHTVVSGKATIVLDATEDARFADNPMVVGDPGIRFNISVPLIAPDGSIPGTICIVDTVARREFSAHDLSLLNDLAEVAMAELALKMTVKVQNRVRAERDAARAMLDAALDYSEVAIWRMDVDTGSISWQGATDRVWGRSAAALATLEEAMAAIHADDRDHVRRDMEAGLDDATGFRSEFRIIAADGSERWLAGRGNYEAGPQDHVMTGVNYDITLRKQREDHREMMMGETRHRMRNLFANINAIVSLTRASAMSVDDFVRRINERIAALTRTQNILFATDVESSSLATLLDDLKNVYPQIAWSGDDIQLNDAAIVALSLVFNELSTNAVKYGALATAHGRVTISSAVSASAEGGQLVDVTWAETGGVALTAPPASTGFGTLLIETSVSDTLGGSITRRWDADGLHCMLKFATGAVPRAM